MALNTKEYQFSCMALYKIWKLFGFKGLWYIIEALTSRESLKTKKYITEGITWYYLFAWWVQVKIYVRASIFYDILCLIQVLASYYLHLNGLVLNSENDTWCTEASNAHPLKGAAQQIWRPKAI